MNQANKPLVSSNQFILYKSIRVLVYIVLLISIVSINISSGLFPSASFDIKDSLHITETVFGLFAFSTYIGKVVGSLVFVTVINSTNRKWLIVVTLATKATFILLFSITTDNIYLLFGYRCYIGLSNMIINAFAPVIVEQFGIHKYKAMLQSLLQMGNPLGRILGFSIHFFANWKFTLIFEGTILLSCAIILAVIPHIYFSSKVVILINSETNEEVVDKKDEKIVSLFKFRNSIPPKSENMEREREVEPVIAKLCNIFRSRLFFLSLMIRTCLIAVQSTLQYWTPDYMTSVIHIEDHSYMKLFSNILLIITAPLGAFVSGIFISFSIKGYQKKNYSPIFISIFYIIECICAFYIPFIKTPIEFIIVVIAYSFFSSACMPMLQGICMTSVDPQYSGIAFSTSLWFSFLIGSGMSPSLYGYFNEHADTDNYAMMYLFLICMGLGLALLPFFVYSCYLKNQAENVTNKRKEFTHNPDSSYNNLYEGRQSISSNAEVIVQELAQAYAEPTPGAPSDSEPINGGKYPPKEMTEIHDEDV